MNRGTAMNQIFKSLMIFSAFFCGNQQIKSQGILLENAIANRQLQAVFSATGNLDGVNTNSHIGKCVSYQLRNLTAKPMTVKLDAGYIFKPEDTTIQPLLFTDNKTWVLAAGATLKGYLNAMCAALHKGSPQKDRSYRLGKMANGVMKKFAELVAKKQYQSSQAQSVLWAITNKKDLYGELSGNTQMEKDLMNFAKTEIGIDPTTRGQIYNPKKQLEVQKKVSVKVSDVFNTEDSGTLVIKILDQYGNVKLQQKLQDQKSPGEVKYEFWISSADLPLGKYIVKYYINNEEAYKTNFELKFDE